jgi:hypothetical protein
MLHGPPRSTRREMNVLKSIVGIPSLFLLALLLGCDGASESTRRVPVLLPEHRTAIQQALASANLPGPSELVINDSGYLVATFEIADPRSVAHLERIATDAILAIRNAMYPLNVVTSYRVTLNGPSPGPGLTLRYGSARFLEGGQVSWEPARK